MPLYADIVLPLAQPAYTFAVPEGMHVEAGQAVAVQFGARKFYTGIVWRVHDRRPPFKTVKSIQRVLYGAPLLSAQQMAFWEWVAAYYMCTPGEVMRVGLPSLMKPSGDTEEEFTEEEFRPRTECYVALAPGLHDEGRLHEAFEKLERRAPRQYEALLELASAGDGERTRWHGACCGPTMPCCMPSNARGTSSRRSANAPSSAADRHSACRS